MKYQEIIVHITETFRKAQEPLNENQEAILAGCLAVYLNLNPKPPKNHPSHQSDEGA